MNSTHTPGPWRICGAGDDAVVRSADATLVACGHVIAHGLRLMLGDVNAANMRLIAAAPMLTEALREGLREMDAVIAGTQTLDAETLAETFGAALKEAGLCTRLERKTNAPTK